MSNVETISADQLKTEYKSILEPQKRAGGAGSDYLPNLESANKGNIIRVDGLHYSQKNRYVRLAKEKFAKVAVLVESTGKDETLKIQDTRIYRVVLITNKQLEEIRKPTEEGA